MLKNIIILSALCLSALCLFAQNDPVSDGDSPEDVTSDLHHLLQYQGTEQNIADFFLQSGTQFRNDTIYAILLPPMGCPRCEGVINPFILELKKQDSLAEVVLLPFYPKMKALEKYLQDRQFIADHILACTDNSFMENFYISTPFFQVPYLVKFDRIHGVLIISKASLGMTMNEEFIRSMIDAKNHQAMVPKKTTEQIEHEAPEISFEILKGKILRPTSIITLKENDEHPIAKPGLPGFSADLRYLSYIDELSFEAVVYELMEPEARLISAVGPGPEEDKMFLGPGISDTLFMFFKQMNIINPMFFSNVIVNDTLIISASLPKIYWENREAEHIACFNQQAYLYKDIASGKVERVLTLPPAPDTSLVASHTTTFFSNDGNLMFLSVSKGWPVSGSESLNWNNTRENPFLESFYDNAPLLAVYDIHGNFIRYFGSLTDFEKQNRLGYTLATPLIRQSDDVYWIVNTHSGDMRGFRNIYDDLPEYSIKLFDVKPMENLPDPESEPLGYMKYWIDHLHKVSLDVLTDNEVIWHILKDGDMVFLKKLDFEGELLDQWLFPNIYEGMEGTTFRLFRKDGKVIVKGIFESPEKTSILEFSPEYTSALE